MGKLPHFLLSGLILVALSASAQAGPSTTFDDYEVYHSVIPSTFIQPQVAEAHGLTRSRSIGLLNISVLERHTDDDTLPKGVDSHLEGYITNNVQQRQRLSFKRVRDGDAIYYLAQFQYRDGELLTFNITASPYGHSGDLPMRFSRELYVD